MVTPGHILLDISYIIFFGIHIMLNIYYIIVVLKQFVRRMKEYEICSKLRSYEINAVVKFKLIYNHKTVLIKNAFIIIILSFELFCITYMLFETTFINRYVIHTHTGDNAYLHEISPNCSVRSTLGYLYHNPASRLLPLLTGIFICSLITLVTVLTTFLKKRYYLHPLTTSLLRYAGWWCVQVFLLSACCTIYTLPLLFILVPSLAFINWIYLIYESKQFVYILKSRIRDIVNYEWDRVHYIQSRDAYRMYVVFSVLYIFSLLTLIFISITYFTRHFIILVSLDNCYFETIYGHKLFIELDQSWKIRISYWNDIYMRYMEPLVTYTTLISLLCPFILNNVWKCISTYIKNRNTPIRYTPVYEKNNRDSYRLLLIAHKRKKIFWF